MFKLSQLSRRACFIAIVGALPLSAAGAATFNRYAVSQGTGAGGSTNFLQSSLTGGALEGDDGKASTALKYPFGVFGVYDNASGGYGIGVVGIATGGYGVAAQSLDNANPSILALPGGNGMGLEALTIASSTAPPIYAEAKGNGDGADIIADGTGYGLMAEAGNGLASIYGYTKYQGQGIGLLGSTSGEGAEAFGYSGNSLDPALVAVDGVGGTDLFGAFTYAGSSAPVESFIVQSGTGNNSGKVTYTGASDVQVSGDLYVGGQVFEDCNQFPAYSGACSTVTSSTASTSIAHSSSGRDVQMFGGHQSLPTVEDFGQAQIVNGRGFVHIDPAFAQTMSRQSPYLVFITPEGDSHSLFTTSHTQQGFEVRESEGGRSTITFDYRIVAKPFADASRRFVAVVSKARIASVRSSSLLARESQFAGLRSGRAHRFVAPAVHDLITPATLHR